MAIATGLSVAVSAVVGPWRVTTGLLVGGLLALFSHRWLKNSAAAAIELSIGGSTPKLRLAQFILRYVVMKQTCVHQHDLPPSMAASSASRPCADHNAPKSKSKSPSVANFSRSSQARTSPL